MSSLIVKTPAICPAVDLGTLKNMLRVDADNTQDDLYIAGLGAAAEAYVESVTDRSIIKKTYVQGFDYFPLFDYYRFPPNQAALYNGNQLWNRSLTIKLYRAGLVAGSSKITYIAEDGSTQVIYGSEHEVASVTLPADYQEDAASEPARLLPFPNVWWPFMQYNRVGAVKIQFDSTMADETAIQADLAEWIEENPDATDEEKRSEEVTLRQAAVDQRVVTAICMTVAHWYRNREAVSAENLNTVPFGVENILWSLRVEDYAPTQG